MFTVGAFQSGTPSNSLTVMGLALNAWRGKEDQESLEIERKVPKGFVLFLRQSFAVLGCLVWNS